MFVRVRLRIERMTEPAPTLKELLGKPHGHRVGLRMQCFQFGGRKKVVSSLPSPKGLVCEVGELALHIGALEAAGRHGCIWPAELDLMTALAGFELESRHADWVGSELTSESSTKSVPRFLNLGRPDRSTRGEAKSRQMDI